MKPFIRTSEPCLCLRSAIYSMEKMRENYDFPPFALVIDLDGVTILFKDIEKRQIRRDITWETLESLPAYRQSEPLYSTFYRACFDMYYSRIAEYEKIESWK